VLASEDAETVNPAAVRQTNFTHVFSSDYHRGSPLRAAAVCLNLEFSGSSSTPATLHLAFPFSRAAFSEVGLLPRLQRGTWTSPLRCLTCELRGRQRCGALAAWTMINNTATRPRRRAVGGPLERGVRQRLPFARGVTLDGCLPGMKHSQKLTARFAGAHLLRW